MEAVHPKLQGETLCLACFAMLADERLIRWDQEITFWPVAAASLLVER
jgi:hypothetical protein